MSAICWLAGGRLWELSRHRRIKRNIQSENEHKGLAESRDLQNLKHKGDMKAKDAVAVILTHSAHTCSESFLCEVGIRHTRHTDVSAARGVPPSGRRVAMRARIFGFAQQ